VSIVTGIPVEHVISVCQSIKKGRRKSLNAGSTGDELRKTLRLLGRSLSVFMRPDWPSPGTVALARLRFTRQTNSYHWIVLTRLHVYDPLFEEPVPLRVYDRFCRRRHARIVSWAAVTSLRVYAFR